MSHGPAVEWKTDRTANKKAKMGIIMVSIYILVYVVFVTINVVNPKLMKMDIGSLNLAIVYGFGLIVLALIQAFIYNHYCTRLEEKADTEDALETKAAIEALAAKGVVCSIPSAENNPADDSDRKDSDGKDSDSNDSDGGAAV